jgi:hypothetical protein
VSFFLRLIGIANAAIWFGTTIGLLTAVWPAFYSPAMLRILPPSHAGAAAQVVMERFLAVHYGCGVIALAHLAMESAYAGKAWHRWINFLVLGMVALTLATGLWLEPKVKKLHLEQYGMRSTPSQKLAAGQSIRAWQSVMHLAGWLGAIGLWVYLWEISGVGGGVRFVAAAKLRG